MTSLSHDPVPYGRERPQWAEFLSIRKLWAALAILMMWLAVLFAAVYGPDFVSSNPGGNSTTIPSAIFVAFFAWLGTISVARYGLHRDKQ
jgi:hypothetical protein